MNFQGAAVDKLAYDVRAIYIFLRLEKRRLKTRLSECEEKIKSIERNYANKRSGTYEAHH